MSAHISPPHFFQYIAEYATQWNSPTRREGHIPASGHEAIRTSVIADPMGFDSLASEWDQLHAESLQSVFQSHSWLRSWWRNFGEGNSKRELHLVAVRHYGKLIAICPFYIESKPISRWVSTRQLRFIGEGISDYSDIILKLRREQEGLRAVADHLGELWKAIDCIYLPNMPDESPAKQMLSSMLADVGIQISIKQSDTCPRTRLRASWPETLADLNSKKRSQVKKRCSQLAEERSMGVEFVESGDNLDEALADLVRLHQERMNETGKPGVFHEGEFETFFREVFKDFISKGWLFLSFLTIDGKRVAAACSYLLNDVVSLHIAGLANIADIRKYSPGVVLHAHCMEKAIQRGAKTYDFLRGTEDYKYRLGAEDRPVWSIFAKRVRFSVRILKNLEFLIAPSRHAA